MRTLLVCLVSLVLAFRLTAQADTIHLTESFYFASAEEKLNDTEGARLEAFAETIKSYAAHSLRLEAFTDEQGTDTFNKDLAQRRADHCTRALARINVRSATTTILSHGEQRARQNTTSDAERKHDRRVDLLATVVRWYNVEEAIAFAAAEQKQVREDLNPTLVQLIKGQQGGRFKVKPNTLVRPDETPAIGPVRIELVEAYKLTDMLLAGLTTTSGGRRLETGGMIKLTATDADGTALQLKAGTEITASIPTDYYNPDMRIFKGTNLTISGVPTDWALTEGTVSRPPKPLTDSLTFGEYLEWMDDLLNLYIDQFSGGIKGCDFIPDMRPEPCRKFYDWLVAHPAPDTPNYVNAATYHVRPKPELVDTNNIVYQPVGKDKIFMSRERKQKITHQRRQRALKIYVRRLQQHERSVAYHVQIPVDNARKRAKYDEDLLIWEEATMAQKQIALAGLKHHDYLLAEAYRLARIGDQERAEAARLNAGRLMEEELLGQEDFTGKSWDVERYLFSVNQLGWANCDLFARESKVVSIRVNLDYSTSSAKVMLLPVGRRSVIAFEQEKNGVWRNKGIPKDLSYHVIGYEVIDGKLVMAHKYVAAADNKLQELEYEPVAITELRDKMTELLENKSR